MKLTNINDALIAARFEAKILGRGDDYYQNGAVSDAVLRGDSLTAEVEGSEYDPYHVRVTLGSDDIADASCTCPYDAEWGGWCKHIAATLLFCAHEPESVEVAAPLSELLAPLDRAALEGLLLHIARREPATVGLIADEAEQLQKVTASPKSAGATPKAVR